MLNPDRGHYTFIYSLILNIDLLILLQMKDKEYMNMELY